jgi:lipopolysaccharide exporter
VSIEKKAARGVAWNMATSMGTRVLSLTGTLILTRFIAPADYGEVSAASVCVMSANVFVYFAFGQYVIANKAPADVAFQAAEVHFGLGIVAMAVVLGFQHSLGIMLGAPGMSRFILGYAIAGLIERARAVPQAILVRDLRFRSVALINSVGELSFTGTAVALASRMGAYAIMTAAIVRSVVTGVLFVAMAPRAEWLKPSRLQKDVVKRLFGYGTPLMLSMLADRAASTWDNLIILRLFGPQVMGAYALSYSLAETPLIYVAERMGDVLLPAFAKMEAAERPAAVVRAASLMALVVAPLGVGLGSVAPTIVHVFFDARWAGMASILMMLSVMTVFQPVTWAALTYLQAEQMTRPVMVLSIARTVLLLSLVALLGWLGGPVWACAGVGAGFAAHALLTVLITARFTPLSARSYFVSVLRPLLACVPMFVAVESLRAFLDERHVPGGISLAAQVLCGGVVYVGAALVLADSNVRDLIRLMRPAAAGAAES